MIKAVLFDLDDTLYSDFAVLDELAMKAAGEYAASVIDVDAQKATDAMQNGRQLLRKMCPDEPEMHDRVLFAKLGLESIGINPIRIAQGMNDTYWNTLIDKIECRDGVKELLYDLKSNRIPVAICTNMLADVQMKKLCKLGIDDICGILVSSEEAGKDKPHSPIFNMCCDKLGSKISETLMVGDSIKHDIEGALGVDMPALWLNWKNKDIPKLDKPFYVASDFIDAAKQIRKLCGIT